MSGKPILSTINTINKLGLQDGPVHPPEPAHTNPPSDRDPHCLSPESTGIIPSSSPNLHYSSMQQHGSHTLRRNESDLGPSGGESPPESSAGGLFRNVSIASYAASIPDTKRSQLSIASNDMASAATTPHKNCKGANAPLADSTDPAPFEQKPLALAALVDPKSLQGLEAMGGTEGLLRGLGTDPKMGLRSWQYAESGQQYDPEKGTGGGVGAGGDTPQSRASADDRRRVYGVNQVPRRKKKGLIPLMWLTLNNKVLALLSVTAIISLALGLYSDFGMPRGEVICEDGVNRCIVPRINWVEGVAVILAILIVVMVGSLNDWQRERQVCKLNEELKDRRVKVIRDGQERDVMVGDIALLEPGEIIPCDGVFLRGHNVRCSGSNTTGESDAIKKATYDECLAEVRGLEPDEEPKLDCFVVSGSKVLEGVGRYVVIAVGPKSFIGRVAAALTNDAEESPLQLQLNKVTDRIEHLGFFASLFLFVTLTIKFFVQLKTEPNRTKYAKGMAFVQILILSLTLDVVAVPEGLPLAVILVLALTTRRMIKEHLLVRVLSSCETMANASVVCTDKTGTLTENAMFVVAGSVGVRCKFVRHLSENGGRHNVDRVEAHPERSQIDDFALEMAELNTVIHEPLRSLFDEALAINSTSFEYKNPETNEFEFIGSQTEAALLRFAKDLNWAPYQQTRSNATIVQMIPFSSERKTMGVVVRASDNKYRFYLKGGSDIVTRLCTRHVVVHQPGSEMQPDSKNIETAPITELEEDNIFRTIVFYTNQTLHTLAIAYRDFETWPPAGHTGAIDEVPYEMIAGELTLIGITGIEDPLRPGVKDAVATCNGAGVRVVMCTGDNALTARSIATQCGIFTAGGIIMEGHAFHGLPLQEQREIAPHIQILARSSPEDKRILVDTLKDLGEIVAATGEGTNDGPALKHADVGFSMGITGTEIAKEASDIILMDDNFASIASAIMWGRCVNDSVRKFLQFQVSVSVTAAPIAVISAVTSDKQKSVLTAIQLLWINLIMDTFAALALATDPASPQLLNRPPDPRTAPLFSVDMYKMIIGQSLYQIFIVLLHYFGGLSFWGCNSEKERAEHFTMIFNTFVFCQIFNSINCRSSTQDKNIFRGLTKNWYFIAITVVEVVIQVLIVFFGGVAFQATPMKGRDWGISVALGFVSIPLGFLIRCIPTPLVERLFIALHIMHDPKAPPRLAGADKDAKDDRNIATDKARKQIPRLPRVHGARMRGSSFVCRSRLPHNNGEIGVHPAMRSMVPSIVAPSVGVGWLSRVGRLEDPGGTDPSRSSAALWRGQIQIHPDTKPDDVVHKWGGETV